VSARAVSARRVSARFTIATATALLVALPLLPPRQAVAQGAGVATATPAPRAERRTPRKVVFTIAGALAGVAATSFYFATPDPRQKGNCSSRNCVVPVSVLGSAFVGYLVGREFDQLHALRYRGGRPLSPDAVSLTLEGEPSVLHVADSTVAVAGVGGVQLFSSTGALRASGRRAAGVRGISALAVAPRSGYIGLGAASGFYLYPPGTAPGALVRDGATSAVEPAVDRMYFAVGTRVESVPLAADSARSWPGIELGRAVNSLAFDAARSTLWALTDSALIALQPDGDSLRLVSTMPLDAAGRRVVLDGTRLAIAFGESGLRLYDARDPAAVRETGRWMGARFVYDASFAGERLFVAGGLEGVYVLALTSSTPTVLGLARELGFATAIDTQGEFTYVLDRSGSALRRIRSDF
jgi:hypothetical protein